MPLGTASLDVLAERGVPVPTYDRRGLVPRIVHIGVGAFHRSHLAMYCHELATAGSDWGICGIGLLPADRAMADALGAQDHLYSLTTRQDHVALTEIVGSLVDLVFAADQPAVAAERIGRDTTAVVSMTVTEAGYRDDAHNRRTFDVIAHGLALRAAHELGGLTVMSCDNMVGNGAAARRCVIDAAGRHDAALAAWVADTCTFPDSMVDRITPSTTEADRRSLVDEHGLIDRAPVVAEPFRQWVIEDAFAAGRPDIAAVGAIITDDVHSWELYKLRLLNAGHMAIAHLATLAGIVHVDEAVATPSLHRFLRRLLLTEAVPTLRPIAGHPPEGYVADVLGRFANTGIRDRLARLCTDGTAKAATFVIPVVVDRLRADGGIDHLAHVLAAWAHYLATVPAGAQAPDASAERVRALASAAMDEPAVFLDASTGFPELIAHDPRLIAAFTAAHRSISRLGPIGAIDLLEHGSNRPSDRR